MVLRWPAGGFATDNDFIAFAGVLDIDYMEFSGPPHQLLRWLSPYYFDIGRCSPTVKVPDAHVLIANSPFYIFIPMAFKEEIHQLISEHLGYTLKMSDNPHHLFNSVQRRIGTGDLTEILNVLDCNSIIAIMYGMKATFRNTHLWLESTLTIPGVSATLDLALEEIPSANPVRFVPQAGQCTQPILFYPIPKLQKRPGLQCFCTLPVQYHQSCRPVLWNFD